MTPSGTVGNTATAEIKEYEGFTYNESCSDSSGIIAEDGTLGGPVAKNITEAEREGLAAATGANPGDCIFFAAGKPTPSRVRRKCRVNRPASTVRLWNWQRCRMSQITASAAGILKMLR